MACHGPSATTVSLSCSLYRAELEHYDYDNDPAPTGFPTYGLHLHVTVSLKFVEKDGGQNRMQLCFEKILKHC